MTADDILKLLAIKHGEDVFVSECKTGPSMCVSGCPRMDGWAMKRSWSKPLCIAYEIKVSRADFLADNKWPEYLTYCNQLYFVTAPGVVKDASEIGAEAGWMVVASTGSRTLTKKKAPYRDVTIPEELFRYLLMRARSFNLDEYQRPTNAARWGAWLAQKKEKRRLGQAASMAIRQLVSERIDKAERENRELKAENKVLAEVRELCKRLGISSHYLWNAERKLNEAVAKVKGGPLVDQLRRAQGSLGIAIEVIEGNSDAR